jgi:L-threonine kinase
MELVMKGVEQGDCQLIGQGATISALANQRILYKPCLEEMIKISNKFGAVGINVAHSGTVIGVLFSQANLEGLQECIESMKESCKNIKYIDTFNLIEGGLRIIEGDLL